MPTEPQICHVAAGEIERLRQRVEDMDFEISTFEGRVSRQVDQIHELKRRCSVLEAQKAELAKIAGTLNIEGS
jgi:predicted nuclease with TOPRIM domain